MKQTPEKLIENINEKTLLNLIQQSFSVNGLSISESKELANALILNKKLLTDIPSIKTDQPLTVYFTHDIDWIYPFHIYSIIKAFLSQNKWLSISQLFQSNIYLENIEKLIAFEEKEHGIKSIFLVGANNLPLSLGRYDIRYTNQNPHFKKLIRLLRLNQNEIGLHSQDGLIMRQQISALKKISGEKIKYHRRHFLKFAPLDLWNELNENNVDVDFSIHNAREIGFKNGIPRHYKAIDFINQSILNTTVVPTILSDNAFFFQESDSVFQQFKASLKTAKEFGASVAILFHPENMIIKPELWEYYDKIIHICKKEGAIISPKLI